MPSGTNPIDCATQDCNVDLFHHNLRATKSVVGLVFYWELFFAIDCLCKITSLLIQNIIIVIIFIRILAYIDQTCSSPESRMIFVCSGCTQSIGTTWHYQASRTSLMSHLVINLPQIGAALYEAKYCYCKGMADPKINCCCQKWLNRLLL